MNLNRFIVRPSFRPDSNHAWRKIRGSRQNAFDEWNEGTIAERGAALFKVAQQLWRAPEPQDNPLNWETLVEQQKAGLPPEGTTCRFQYGGTEYNGTVLNGVMQIDGLVGSFGSFSAASKGVTKTSRNGWLDWYLLDEDGGWTLADDWRKAAFAPNA